MTNQCKPTWFNGLNLSGLWFRKPKRGYWDKNLHEWYDKSGDFSAEVLGLDMQHGHATFASESKKEVELWTLGIQTAMAFLRRWAHD